MPYVDVEDLPLNLQRLLPYHAQRIYVAAYNSARLQYGDDNDIPYKVAWAAVEKQYKKSSNGEWVLKSTDRVPYLFEKYGPIYNQTTGTDKLGLSDSSTTSSSDEYSTTSDSESDNENRPIIKKYKLLLSR